MISRADILVGYDELDLCLKGKSVDLIGNKKSLGKEMLAELRKREAESERPNDFFS